MKYVLVTVAIVGVAVGLLLQSKLTTTTNTPPEQTFSEHDAKRTENHEQQREIQATTDRLDEIWREEAFTLMSRLCAQVAGDKEKIERHYDMSIYAVSRFYVLLGDIESECKQALAKILAEDNKGAKPHVDRAIELMSKWADLAAKVNRTR